MSGSDEEEWSDDSVPELEGENEDNGPQQLQNGYDPARAWQDPWKKFKHENEVKCRAVLADRQDMENVKQMIKVGGKDSNPRLEYISYVSGTSQQDLHSRIRPAEESFDIFRELLRVESDLVKHILEYCESVTVRACRLVSKLWSECVDKWFFGRNDYLLKHWSTGEPTRTEHRCQVSVSCVAADDFLIAAGLENGKVQVFNRLTGECDLLFVAHGGMVTALQVSDAAILSAGRERRREIAGSVQVWDRGTARHVDTLRPPYKTDLSNEDSFCFLLLKHSFLFAVGVEKDVWIWQQSWRAGRPHYACQHRIKGHYSRVLCCDADSQGRIMTGSHDAQVRLWNLGPDLKDRTKKVCVHNQHGNPVTSVEVRWPLGLSSSSGSVRLYHHPTGACLRTFRFSAYVYDFHFNENHFVTSHQDGSLNFWSLPDCLQEGLTLLKNSLHRGKVVIKPGLDDQDVWGNLCVQRQGRFVHETSGLVVILDKSVMQLDYWATRGRREVLDDEVRSCETPSSLPSLVSEVSEDDEWDDDVPDINQALLNGH